MFSEKLRSAMDAKNINLTELSAISGIGKSSISQYLSGKNSPTAKRKIELAKALGVSPDYFAGEQKPIINLPVRLAAKLMGKSDDFLYLGLQNGAFPFGYAVKMTGGWSYYISPQKFAECTGIDIKSALSVAADQDASKSNTNIISQIWR